MLVLVRRQGLENMNMGTLRRYDFRNYQGRFARKCPRCEGHGIVDSCQAPCPVCGGDGFAARADMAAIESEHHDEMWRQAHHMTGG